MSKLVVVAPFGLGRPAQPESTQRLPRTWQPFASELNISPEGHKLAALLMRVHWQTEWPGSPLPAMVPPAYTDAALMAVRLCSEVDRKVAQDTAIQWGVAKFEALQRELASPDATEDVRARAVASWIGMTLDIALHSLRKGASGAPHPATLRLVESLRTGEDSAS